MTEFPFMIFRGLKQGRPAACFKCMKTEKQRLLIIGGGFGGLTVARYVDKSKWDVVLVDRNNYHSFPPLFYQVASSGLEPASISFPLRREIRGRHYRGVSFHMGTVRRIDVAAKKVETEYETLRYDALVLAAGTTNNFFGIPDLEKHVFTLKSTTEAIRCRNEVLARLERASLCRDDDLRRRLLTFVVVGGGPTGVEIAGALGELKRFILRREYPAIDPAEMRVVLVEGSPRLLGAMSEKSGADALEALRQLMVEVQLQKVMKSYDDKVLAFSDGSTIAAETVIWTAGITGVDIPVAGTDVKPVRGGRWAVDGINAVAGIPDMYAIGDICLQTPEAYPKGLPQVAPVAMQQARCLARNLSRADGEAPEVFVYRDKGSMATIGRNRAVVDMGRLHLRGRVAWLVWMGVHLVSLLGMRNRTVVFINWIWGYFTFSSGLRLLLRPDRYPLRSYWEQ